MKDLDRVVAYIVPDFVGTPYIWNQRGTVWVLVGRAKSFLQLTFVAYTGCLTGYFPIYAIVQMWKNKSLIESNCGTS